MKLKQGDNVRNAALIGSWYRESFLKLQELEITVVGASPDNYKVKPSEIIAEYKKLLAPWIEVEKKDELVDLVRVLDYLKNKKK